MKRTIFKFIRLIIIILVLVLILFYIFNIYNERNEKENFENIKSDMLLIQGACKVLKDNCIVNKSDEALVGKKLNEADDDIINEFKSKNIIDENEYDKYYVLNDEDLSKLNIDVKNIDKSYYLINYDTSEVIFTLGYEGKYKLSEME